MVKLDATRGGWEPDEGWGWVILRDTGRGRCILGGCHQKDAIEAIWPSIQDSPYFSTSLFSLFSSKLFDISLILSMQLLLCCRPHLFHDMLQSWHGWSCYTIHTACIVFKQHLPCCLFLLIPCFALILHSCTVKHISRQPRNNVVENALCYTCYELQMFLGVTESLSTVYIQYTPWC